MPRELRPLVRARRLRSGDPVGLARSRTWSGTTPTGTGLPRLAAANVGVGPARAAAATAALLEQLEPHWVVVLGVAGAVRDDLGIADVVVPRSVLDLESGATYRPDASLADRFDPGRTPGRRRPGAHPTSDAALVTVTNPGLPLPAAVVERFGAVDMETAAIARECGERGVLWAAVRAVSDLPGTFTPDIAALLDGDGRVRASGVVSYLVRRPSRAALLWHLGFDTRRAVRSSTAALLGGLAEWSDGGAGRAGGSGHVGGAGDHGATHTTAE